MNEIVENRIGGAIHVRGDECAYHCPKCNWKNPRLMVNYEKDSFHCWYCNWGGKSLIGLLKEIGVDWGTIKTVYGESKFDFKLKSSQLEVIDIVRQNLTQSRVEELPYQDLTIPNGYEPVISNKKAISNEVLRYLKGRGLSIFEIKMYNLMYNPNTKFLLIPSYDYNNKLNYFVLKNIEKGQYILLETVKKSEVIMFNSYISDKYPLIICEGTFDAFKIGFNALPLNGVITFKKHLDFIQSMNFPEIIVYLDKEAINNSFFNAMKLFKLGYNVSIAHSNNYKDAGETPKEYISKVLDSRIKLDTTSIIKFQSTPKHSL